jgi:hypothetical protein
MEGTKKDGLRIYMDMGTRERGSLTGDYWKDALAVRDALLKQGYVEGDEFLWNPGEGDEHNEKAWAKRLPVALRFLMAKEKDKPQPSAARQTARRAERSGQIEED